MNYRPFQFVPDDGPSKGRIIIVLRHYLALGDHGGLYVWSEKSEAYRWHEGLTMDEWMAQNSQDQEGG